ncbi:MAG: fused MFS/spermidine synthase [Gammaproteobacteria bacterium]|nr:fused MFS/spermidine synthase [Gammaproteobacteria bacterium]MDE0452270.1 fused MFS/spermidine synthase [Gammaproteobacteria bacterium]
MNNERTTFAPDAQLWLFTATMFLGAALLFWIQPLFTKMVLPLLGGSPSVWNTAMVFFQAALLCGYGYAHLVTRHLGSRSQCIAHFCVLVAAAIALPIGIAEGWQPDPDATPSLWLLGLLAVSIGAPFFAVATTAPLIQRWFSRTGHPHASDPYFLYAASNLGSVAVLLAFPFVIEPLVGTRGQALAWTLGFAILAACIAGCGVSVWGSSGRTRPTAPARDGFAPGWRHRAAWLAYSAVPSALLLGVTGHISTDIASVPLLWVVPLTLYLLSFVNAFARRPLIPSWLAVRCMAFGLVILAALFPWREPASVFLPLHLVAFFFIATACHAALAGYRPDARFLTEFYLFVAIGGLVGGVFVALVAPLVFDAVLEYPLSLVLAAALLPNRKGALAQGSASAVDNALRGMGRGTLWRVRDIVLAALILAVLVGGRWFTEWADLPLPFIVFAGALGVFALFVLARQVRPLGFAFCIAALLIAGQKEWSHDDTVWSGRSFFGVYRIVESEDPRTRSLIHGTTNHGGQWMKDDGSIEPADYYTSASPVAAVIPAPQAAMDRQRTGLVGLGTGALAYYRRPGDTWRYFEIDPLVAWMATESGYFDMLSTHDPSADIVLGDARLTLAREPDGSFDLLIIDAFSSDAIPVHLLTREAVGMYMRKLKDRGVLLLHISNRMLNLEPVVAGIAEELGLTALLGRRDKAGGDSDPASAPSRWVAIARDGERLEQLSLGEGWSALDPESRRVWRDDFSNLAGVIQWRVKLGD